MLCCKRRPVAKQSFPNETRRTLTGRGGRIGRSDTNPGSRLTCRAQTRKDDCLQNRCRDVRQTCAADRNPHCNVGRSLSNNHELGGYVATNKEITNSSRQGPQAMQQVVEQIIREKRPLNAVNIATVFHASAKIPQILTAEVLEYLINALHGVDLDSRAIGNACYGLQGLNDSPTVHRLLEAITTKVTQCTSSFNPQQIGNALYGLQNLNDSPEVRSLLRGLEPQIHNCRELFSSQAIASGCLGVRRLGDSCEVRSIFGALAAKVEQLNDMGETHEAISSLMPGSLKSALIPHVSIQTPAMDGQGVGNALYSLQSMEESPEVLRLIMAISIQAERLSRPMKAQELSSAFYGLRCLRKSPLEIRRLLSALATQGDICTERFMGRHIATSLYGLRWLGDSVEARKVLLVLAEKTKNCVEPFDGHAVGNSLYGLQSFPCCSEVRTLLTALSPKVQECSQCMTGQEIGNAFYGFRSLSDCPQTRRVLVALSSKPKESGPLDAQAISNALYGLHAFGSIPEIAMPIARIMSKKIWQCKDTFRAQGSMCETCLAILLQSGKCVFWST